MRKSQFERSYACSALRRKNKRDKQKLRTLKPLLRLYVVWYCFCRVHNFRVDVSNGERDNKSHSGRLQSFYLLNNIL